MSQLGARVFSYAWSRSCMLTRSSARVLLTRFFQSGLDIKTPFVILFFEQIFQSMYMFYARENFLTLQILTKEDRQTTGLEKGVLTATARVGGHWQMRVIWAGFH